MGEGFLVMSAEDLMARADAAQGKGDKEFAAAVCDALGRHGIHGPQFNLVAGTHVAPSREIAWKMLFFPEAAQNLIFASIRALHEYGRDGKISLTAREDFILADMQDRLRGMEPDYTAEEHQKIHDRVMDHVTSKMTAIATLATAPPPRGRKP